MTDSAFELKRLRDTLAASGVIAYDWDLIKDTVFWFEGASDAFGLAHIDSVGNGEGFNALIYPEDIAYRVDALSRLCHGAEIFECEYRVQLANGEHQWMHDCGLAEISPSGNVVRLRGSLRPFGSRRRGDARLDYLANHDGLTGHFNRTRLREALDYSLYYAQRYDVIGAYLVIGIDKLTVVNQAFGHEIADSIILAISEKLDRCLRASDIIGRVGGDRFGAVLANCPGPELIRAAEKILDAARNTVVDTPAGPIHVTVSIGAVSFPAFVRTAADAMTKADVALEQAKHAGRDCFAVFRCTDEQMVASREGMVIAERVQQALRDGRMRFAYQPIVDARTREPVHYECLLRMVEPTGAVVAAGRFMPAIEELGMIRPIDRLGFEMAVRDLTAHPSVRLAVNVSGLTTSDRAWLRTAVAVLRNKPDIAERLTIEITETAGLEDIDACARFVATLRDLGCLIALDDFGAGYTSFRHLKQLAVNMVKIDGSFVRNIADNPDNLVFVRTLIDLARNFNLDTVAECVETEEEARLLTAEGVDYLQGYALGKPSMEMRWPATARLQPMPLPLQAGAGKASSAIG